MNDKEWAEFKEKFSNELMHGRQKVSEGGARNGETNFPDRYDPIGNAAKGVLDAAAEEFGTEFTYKKEEYSFLHPGISASVYCGSKKIGFIGQLSYEVAEDAEITKNCFVGEIDFGLFMKKAAQSCKYTAVSPFRSVKRDLALVTDEATECGEIEKVIYDACKAVTDIRLFDIYRSAAIGEGKKSMAFTLTLASGDTELLPEEADKYIAKILKALEFKLGIKLR